MKRKLNENDAPDSDAPPNPNPDHDPNLSGFAAFNIDARLLQALTKEGLSKPTSIQHKAIKAALEGFDVLARAKTGTGKTAAYLLPLLQSILSSKATVTSSKTSGLILVPTRELASQVYKAIQRFTTFCSRDVQVINLAQNSTEEAQKAQLASSPNVVVATPARARQHGESKSLDFDALKWLVVDEADLVMSYGYEEDFRALVAMLPTSGVQAFLASATLTTEVDELKALFCQNPVIIDLQDEERDEKATVSQYAVKCGEDEKFLLLVAIFKLKLVHGKCIVFVGDVDRCYRVKMVMDQFGVRSCVLNSELPVNSRIHVVEEFNKNVYDIIVATDESGVANNQGNAEVGALEAAESSNRDKSILEPTLQHSMNADKSKAPKRARKGQCDPNYGVSRGIDFQAVACVLNFDLPTTAKSYTHRIGRTGRLGRSGIALSFVVPADQYRKHKMLTFPTTKNDERVLEAIQTAQDKRGYKVEDYKFDIPKLQGLWYRVSSALKIVTPGAVRQARLKELREELLKSEKLKRHLEENPDDLKWLRHDQESKAAKAQPHLKSLPDYLVPGSNASNKGLEDVGYVGSGRQSENRIRKARKFNRMRRNPKEKANPLKSFRDK